MTDQNDNNDQGSKPAAPTTGPARAPLTLKPRAAGSVSSGTVRQSFSHGRTKTVVVETKRRVGAVPGAPDRPRPAAFDVKARPRPEAPAPAPAAPAAREPQLPGGLSAEEMEARRKAIETARAESERREAERKAREDARRAQEEERRREENAIAAPQPKEPAPQPAQAAQPAAPRAAAPERAERPAAPERPSANFGARAPRPESGNFGARAPRPESRPEGGFGARAPRPEGDRAFRTDRPQGDRPARPFSDRPARPEGAAGASTVRYSALAPRPAPAGDRGPRPGGPRRDGPGGPPAAPEVAKPSRAAGPRSPDRKPAHLEEADRARRAKNASAGEGKAVSRIKGEPGRRQGRLTISAVAGDEDAAERMRSLASVRRAREREKEKRRGGVVEQPKVARDVVIPDVITVGDLANRMATRGVEVIKFLMRQGLLLKINDVIDSDTAELVATEFGHTVRRVSEADVEEGFITGQDDTEDAVTRPPVVAVMGHVDHGKTSLLDALRSTDVVAGEAGGITQHIGAYQVRLPGGQRVTFLDTPGHAAFSAMRARGANVTDIVILVVAADDGVMPQTIEAINHAKAAGSPIIVAVNKIDKPDADPTKVINELLQHEIVAESLGGDTQIIEVSATKKMGLENLIEAILLQAEVMDLKADPNRTAEGVVIEAKLDKGRGPVATVLVNRGTLRRGDIVVAGGSWGRVRALINERDEQINEAFPSDPVEILGLDAAPEAGEPLAVVENEARARELTDYRERKKREKSGGGVSAGASLADMMSKLQDKKISELPVVIKADVQGSAEAIVGSLNKLATDEVRARIIHSAVGGINESDVLLAKGAGAPIIGFNVRASKQAQALAEREGVEIRYYAIIYDLIDDIKGVLSGMLAPIQRETRLGEAEVLQVFDITKVGKVAGCKVADGVVRKGARVRIIRDDVVVLELGTLQTLKRFKDEVNEVQSGQECGMAFAGFQDIKPGDFIECFTVEEVKRSL